MLCLTDPAVLRALCEKYQFAFSKGFGQNFLVNPGVTARLAEEGGAAPGVGVLEIGPGFGTLTQQLAMRADKVVAVELDKRLPAVLAETLADFNNVKVVQGDALRLDLAALLAQEFGGGPVVLCANLPYYITSPLLMHLLQQRLPVQSITVLVQKEAADRITALPGTRQSGAISCAVQYYTRPETLFTVQPGSFYPPPKVVSAVIRLHLRAAPLVDTPDEAAFFALVRAAFGQRRKTAANSIAAGLGLPKSAVLAALKNAGLAENIRPEQLTLEEFAALQTALAAV